VYNDRAHPDRFYYRSDHYPFIRFGIPTAFFFCGTTPDYHTPNDTIERADFKKMEKVTRLTYLVTYDVGNRPQLLTWTRTPRSRLAETGPFDESIRSRCRRGAENGWGGHDYTGLVARQLPSATGAILGTLRLEEPWRTE